MDAFCELAVRGAEEGEDYCAGEGVEFVVADEGEVFEGLREVGFEEAEAVGGGGVGLGRGVGTFDADGADAGFD